MLVIEDNPGDARLFEEHLRESGTAFRLRHERTLKEGLSVLIAERPDVLVVDLGLPDSEDVEAVRRCAKATPEVPIVVLTGQGNLEVALAAQQAGAAEYLQKGELTPELAGRTLRWAAERARTERKLSEAKARYESLVEDVFYGSPVGVIVLDADLDVVWANEATERYFELDRECILGTGKRRLIEDSIKDLFDRPERFAQKVLSTYEDNTCAERFECHVLPGPGREERWLEHHSRPIEKGRYEGGRVELYVDITERKAEEQKRRVLAEAVEQAKEAVVITEAAPLDRPGPRIQYVNAAFETMTGYDREEIKGETPRVLQGPDTDRAVLDSLREALEAGESWQGAAVNYRKDGTPYRLQWNVAPVHEEDGSIKRWVSVQRDVTEERRREEVLRQSRERYRSLFENSNDAILVHDLEGRIQEANPRAETLFGYAPEELLGREISDLQTDETEAAYTIPEAFQSDDPARRTARYRRSDGSVFWGEVSASVTNIGGTPVVRTMIRDVTDRKEAEKDLREQEARFRGLTNSIPGIVYQFYARSDGTYGFYFVGEQAEDVLGISADPDGFAERYVEHVPGSHREELLQSIEEAVEQRTEWHVEMPFERPDGRRIWLLARSTPEQKEGELVFNGVLLDIAERKDLEKRRQQVIERVTDAIVEVDSEWRFTLVNEEAETLYDMKEEDLLGEDFWKVFAEAQGTRFEEEYRRVMQARTPTRFEEYFSGLDGWFDVQVFPNDDGGLAFYFEDITERKQREQELRNAKEKAEAAADLKSAMLANMSHEVRTPLTSILGFTEVLSEGLDGQHGLYAEKAHRSSERLMRTLTSVLEISRLEAGAMPLDREDVDLCQVANEVTDLLGPEAEDEEIGLSTDVPGHPVEASLNRDAVRRILENLVENAIKFTLDGGQVTVRLRAEKDKATVEVEDSGVGIGEDSLSDIFEAFEQESSGLDREYEGTGLGLSIVKKLVGALGGTVNVKSEKGVGTCFTVRLPLSHEED